MHIRSMLFGAVVAFTSSAALAQGGERFFMPGTVEAMDGHALTLKADKDGAMQTFTLSPQLTVLQSRPATLADIRPHDFVASAAVHGVDGKLHSTELRIFPEALRGLGEGQRPMGDPRQQTMTNATVTGAATVGGSSDLKVTFAGGTSELVVDPGVPVSRIDIVDSSLVKPGAKIRVVATREASGAVATRIFLQ